MQTWIIGIIAFAFSYWFVTMVTSIATSLIRIAGANERAVICSEKANEMFSHSDDRFAENMARATSPAGTKE